MTYARLKIIRSRWSAVLRLRSHFRAHYPYIPNPLNAFTPGWVFHKRYGFRRLRLRAPNEGESTYENIVDHRDVCFCRNWAYSTARQSSELPGGLMTQEWTDCNNAVLNACALVGTQELAACRSAALQRYLATRKIAQAPSGGVRPNAFNCPSSHPIKGNFTTYNGNDASTIHQAGCITT